MPSQSEHKQFAAGPVSVTNLKDQGRRGLRIFSPDEGSLVKLLVSYVQSCLQKCSEIPQKIEILTDLSSDILALAHLPLRHTAPILFMPYSFESLLSRLSMKDSERILTIVLASDFVSGSERARGLASSLASLYPEALFHLHEEIFRFEPAVYLSEVVYQESNRVFKVLEIEKKSRRETILAYKAKVQPSFKPCASGWGLTCFESPAFQSEQVFVFRHSISRFDLNVNLPLKIGNLVRESLITKYGNDFPEFSSLTLLTPFLPITACVLHNLENGSAPIRYKKFNVLDFVYGWHPGLTLCELGEIENQKSLFIVLEPLSILRIVVIEK